MNSHRSWYSSPKYPWKRNHWRGEKKLKTQLIPPTKLSLATAKTRSSACRSRSATIHNQSGRFVFSPLSIFFQREREEVETPSWAVRFWTPLHWENKERRIIGFLSEGAAGFLPLLRRPTLRPLLVLSPLAFICFRITCQLNLVIACVIWKQTSAPNLWPGLALP